MNTELDEERKKRGRHGFDSRRVVRRRKLPRDECRTALSRGLERRHQPDRAGAQDYRL
jgi:hypothetical protein